MVSINPNLIERLKREQLTLSKKIKLKDKIPVEEIRTVAGIDVTFIDSWKNPTKGIACIVVIDIKNNFKVLETVFAKKTVDFPYIPTFLAYRELPVILEAYKSLKSCPDAFMLDGMGILHPRKTGIASHFGVITDTVSVGCGKSRLIGKFKEIENAPLSYTPVYVDGDIRGYALRTKKNTNPIFISPGNNISLNSSLKLTIQSLDKYKLPEPTRKAHLLLQQYRKEILKNGNF